MSSDFGGSYIKYMQQQIEVHPMLLVGMAQPASVLARLGYDVRPAIVSICDELIMIAIRIDAPLQRTDEPPLRRCLYNGARP